MAINFMDKMDASYVIPNEIGIGDGSPIDIRCQCDTVEDFKTFITNTGGFDIRYNGLITYEKNTEALKVYKGNNIWEQICLGNNDNSNIDLSNYYTIEQVNTLLQSKANETHNHDSDYARKVNEHTHTNKTILDGITSSKIQSWDAKSNFSGSYNDLTNKPNIPIVDVTKSYVDTELAKKANTSHNHSEYTTESRVSNMIAEASLGGGEVDLSGLATKDELNVRLDGKSFKYLTKAEYDAIDIKDENIVYAIIDEEDLSHTHDNKTALDKITDSKINSWDSKATGNHNHDGRYANASHRHDASEIDNLPSGGSSTTVVDNLTSTSTTSALSANQGKVLDNKITVLNSKVDDINLDTIGVFTSPNGTKYFLKVADDGSLYTERDIIPDSELPSDFPKYTIIGESSYLDDFLITPHTDNQNVGYIFIINSKGQVKWYKKLPAFAYGFKKCKNKQGKVRYAYYQTINKEVTKFSMNGGYDNTELVVLDERFNEIDMTRLKASGTVANNYPTENHDYLFIDDGHYIVLSYHPNVVTNIPSLEGGYKVVNCVIQEIKNNEVVWHFESIDHIELYSASCFNNNYASFPISASQYNDYAHINSIQLDKRDGNILSSWRHIGLVKIERFTGRILWIMGRNRNDISNSTIAQCGYLQHDARYEEDYSITIFDNSGCSTNNMRVCRYWIDEVNKTLTKFEELKSPKVRSPFMGSAKLVDSAKNIYDIAYGGNDRTIAFHEYDFDANTELMKMTFNDGHDLYRVFRGIEDNSWDSSIPSNIKLEGVSISSDLNIYVGRSESLPVTYVPLNATNKNMIWSSSDSNIATVSNGVVLGINAGNCIITATSEDGGFVSTCNVSVSENISVADPVFELTTEKVFNGVDIFVDTGIELFDTDKDFSIFIDFTDNMQNTGNPGGNMAVLHCMKESSPWNGIVLDGNKASKFRIASASPQLGLFDENGVEIPYYSHKNQKYVIVKEKGNQNLKVYNYNYGQVQTLTSSGIAGIFSQSLLLGCNQDTTGVKSRFWNGTIHDCKIWFKALSEEDVNNIFSK